MKRCPFCAEEIQQEAKLCRYCRADLVANTPPQPITTTVIAQPQKEWSPGIAAVLSLVIPGAGQMYKGQVGIGILWLIAVVAGYVMFVFPGFLLHLICIVTSTSGDPYARQNSAARQPAFVPAATPEMMRHQDRTFRKILAAIAVLFVAAAGISLFLDGGARRGRDARLTARRDIETDTPSRTADDLRRIIVNAQEPCSSIARAMFLGYNVADSNAEYWSAECGNGRQFMVRVAGVNSDSTVTECSAVRRGGVRCFERLGQ